MIVDEGGLSDEATDSELDEEDIDALEDGCNSAGEEVRGRGGALNYVCCLYLSLGLYVQKIIFRPTSSCAI